VPPLQESFLEKPGTSTVHTRFPGGRKPEKTRWQWHDEITDLVEERRATVGELDSASLCAFCSGEGASSQPKRSLAMGGPCAPHEQKR
jgi:hypothetical protein